MKPNGTRSLVCSITSFLVGHLWPVSFTMRFVSSTVVGLTLISSLLGTPAFCQADGYEPSSDEQPQFIIYLPRGDGTKGTFGGVVPTGTLAQSDWFILDQKARQSILDENLSNAENLFKQGIQKAEAKAMYEPGVINSFCGLAFLYHKQGNNAESERVYEYAMRYLEGVSGGRDSARFADYLPDLAWLYNAHGKPDKAEVLLKSAIAIRERRFGEYSKELEKSLGDYAYFLRKNGRDTEARHLDARIKLIQSHVSE
ncbi:tetratricopeptide repeat protein [Candidatus Obscuribacterales bacterium]|nr:tetratricopeptide repeat protein [Candidatus Obscuribacterales bacterium]